jgi:hypothetical protein
MKNIKTLLLVLLALTLAVQPASAALVGDTVDYSTGATGTVQVTNGGPPTTLVATPASEFFVCVGPNGDNCVNSGLYGDINVEDTSIVVTFFGSTFPSDGTFTLTFSNLGLPVGNVVKSGSGLTAGDLNVTSFSIDSITLTGTSAGFFAGNGATPYTFTIEAVPEPASVALMSMGLAALILRARRAHRRS